MGQVRQSRPEFGLFRYNFVGEALSNHATRGEVLRHTHGLGEVFNQHWVGEMFYSHNQCGRSVSFPPECGWKYLVTTSAWLLTSKMCAKGKVTPGGVDEFSV